MNPTMQGEGSRKKKRGRPRVDTEPIRLRLERETLAAIDAFIARHPSVVSRQGALTFMAEAVLMDERLLSNVAGRRMRYELRQLEAITDDEFDRLLLEFVKERIGSSRDASGKPSARRARRLGKATAE